MRLSYFNWKRRPNDRQFQRSNTLKVDRKMIRLPFGPVRTVSVASSAARGLVPRHPVLPELAAGLHGRGLAVEGERPRGLGRRSGAEGRGTLLERLLTYL